VLRDDDVRGPNGGGGDGDGDGEEDQDGKICKKHRLHGGVPLRKGPSNPDPDAAHYRREINNISASRREQWRE
jgi:hypothetical protein